MPSFPQSAAALAGLGATQGAATTIAAGGTATGVTPARAAGTYTQGVLLSVANLGTTLSAGPVVEWSLSADGTTFYAVQTFTIPTTAAAVNSYPLEIPDWAAKGQVKITNPAGAAISAWAQCGAAGAT